MNITFRRNDIKEMTKGKRLRFAMRKNKSLMREKIGSGKKKRLMKETIRNFFSSISFQGKSEQIGTC